MSDNTDDSGSWLRYRKANSQAAVRLFCFPYAGGGALSYRTWADQMPIANVEVCPVELPGRGLRLREQPFTALLPLVQALAESLQPFMDRPFIFFGHSMGAMIAFELARLLRWNKKSGPCHLFASACRAPQVADTEPVTYDYPEEEFKQELRRLKGTPEMVLSEPELMQLVLPSLRADFAVTQTYEYRAGEPLECGISVYGGLADDEISRERLSGWRDQTTGHFKLRMFPGDHFFLSTSQGLLLRVLAQELHSLVPMAT
jgi:surfactin synthase thioesterase subunit